eukprot:1842478-Rhodomonas_salina.1
MGQHIFYMGQLSASIARFPLPAIPYMLSPIRCLCVAYWVLTWRKVVPRWSLVVPTWRTRVVLTWRMWRTGGGGVEGAHCAACGGAPRA